LLPVVALAALLAPAAVWAQKPPPPLQPNPQAPVIALTAPAGMQRGTSVELTLTGTNLAGPTGLSTSFPAKVTFPTDNKNGKDNIKLRVRLDVGPDAPLGFHAFRLATTRGMSNFRLFCIDDLPEVGAVDTRRNKTMPQTVPIPCVVAGRIDAETSDYYKIAVKAGQRVSFEVLGRRLGSPLDPQISLYDSKTMREIAYDNDAPGCQSDPRLTYVFKTGGDYLLEVKDVLNRGGPEYVYRLRIGDFPCATVPIPMAARRGAKVAVNFAGPTVDGVAPAQVDVPTDPAVTTISVAPRGASGLHGWPVSLTVSDHEELLEQEPNDQPSQANRIPIPGGITGRFLKSNDLDCFLFAGKKGQKLLIEAHTLEQNSPTLVYMVVKDGKGKGELARSNPQQNPPADQRIEFTPPADADYLVEVQHLNYQGGPSEAYRLAVTPSFPRFDLSLSLERFDAPQAGAVSLPILATRRGYPGPIELSVDSGHPGITGKATIPAGQPAQPNQFATTLVVQVHPDVPPGPHSFMIKGIAMIAGKQQTEYLTVRPVISQNLNNLQYPPPTLFHQIALAVKERPPFDLKVEPGSLKLSQGGKARLKVLATRHAGYQGPIAVEVKNLPANVQAAKGTIPMGQTAVELDIMAAANAAPANKMDVAVVGTATGAGNQQNTSPTFTVAVQKK
jgi:hypothetical protein